MFILSGIHLAPLPPPGVSLGFLFVLSHTGEESATCMGFVDPITGKPRLTQNGMDGKLNALTLLTKIILKSCCHHSCNNVSNSCV